MSEDSIEKITKLIAGIGALLGAILALLGPLHGIWMRVLKPFFKFVLASSTLVIPNGLSIGLLLYWIAKFYWEAGSPEFIITNQAVFTQLIALLTGLVSLYSFLWSIWVYPKIQPWFSAKPKPQQSVDSGQNQVTTDDKHTDNSSDEKNQSSIKKGDAT